MLIVADSSPINVLVVSGLADVLPKLFGQVMIPSAVADELTHPHTPAVVAEFIRSGPTWLIISDPMEQAIIPPLDRGESAAIRLALEHNVSLLLIDERNGRRIASQCGLNIVGTVGILERAAQQGLLELEPALHMLPPDFLSRLATQIIPDALLRDRRRRGLQ